MNDLFYIDSRDQTAKTWTQFIEDINAVSSIEAYLKRDSYYDLFVFITASILSQTPITLLDSDFSSDEIDALIGELDWSKEITPINHSSIKDKESLLNLIQRQSPKWSVTIYTSGTTGLPKQVAHTMETLTRFVQVSDKHRKAIWGFAYNPTHMAGLQVLFQALFNGNTLIRLFQLTKNQIEELIAQYGITNLSATPTFYRMLLPCHKQYYSVVRLTSGGERFDTKTAEQIAFVFPHAKITNVYASTEVGTLFATDGDVFQVKETLANKIKFEQGELLIHHSLMGKVPEGFDNAWYHTGDMVELVGDNPFRFKFLSRKNEMINVGGYKVSPSEVEQVIREYSGVQSVRVYGKPNALIGNIIIADIVVANPIAEVNLRLFLKERLQEYKIPRMFLFKDKIEQTRTGKIKR